jgi:hypothetical protein
MLPALVACGRVGFDDVPLTSDGGTKGVVDAATNADPDAGSGAGTGAFGTMQVGISTQNTGADRVWLSRAMLTETAQVHTIVAHLAGGSSSSTVRGVLYRDASGAPSTLVGVTTDVMVAASSSPAWVPLAFATPVSLAPGMYWIGTHSAVQVGIAYQSAMGASKFNNDIFSDGTDATYAGGAQTFTLQLSIYAEYTR